VSTIASLVDNPAGLDTQAQKEITARGIQAETLPNFGLGGPGFVRLASAARELEANNAVRGLACFRAVRPGLVASSLA